MIIDQLFTQPIFESQNNPITQFASNAHEEWRRNFDPTGTKPRIKKNSDGTEGDINVPFEKLHPDWQKENLAAGRAAQHAVKHFGNNMEKAAEFIHRQWMKRNPKADYNAAQHVPYDDLPDDEKEKDRVHVRTMMQLMGHSPEQGVAVAGFPGAPDVEMPPMKPSGDPKRDKLKQEYIDLHREIKSLVDLQYTSTSDEEKIQAKARIKRLNDRADQIRAILEPRQPPNEWQKKTYGYDDNWNKVDQGAAEGKIKLSTDPNWYGAEIGDYKASGPVVNIPANRLVGFEPDDKMNQPASKANVEKIVAGLKQGAKLPPLMVRQYKNGYQVLDGHHRFWAYKLLGVKSIPAQVVPAEDIEEITKQGVAEATGDEKFDTIMGRMQKEPTIPDAQMPPTDVKDLYHWAVENHKPYHKIFAKWANREGYKSVAPALQKAGNLDSDALDYWTPDVWKLWFGPDSEMPHHWSKERVPDELRDYLETVFDAYENIWQDWPTEYRQIGQQDAAKGRQIDEMFADQGSGSTDRDNADYMKRRNAAKKAGYTGRETKAGTWRVFKDGNAVAAAGPFKSADEAAAWIKKHKQGITEMDKSQPSAGRDTGPRSGPEKIAKTITKEKMVKHALDALSKSMAKKDDKKKDVKESDPLMLKLRRALIKEGRVKELADDLKTMNDSDFMKKYGKVKAAIRKDMKRVDEAAQPNYTPQEMADILSGKKTQQQVDAERAKKIDDQTDDLVMRVDKQGRRVDKNGKLLPPPKTWTNPPINPPPGKMQQYEGLDEQDAAGQQFVGTGTSSNWQMSVDIAAMNARKKAAQSIAGTNSFQGVQLPPGTKYGPQDTKSDGTGKYVSTYTITLPAPSQSAEPPPAAPANNYLDSSPATSGATGSMSTGAPAAVGPATGNYMKVNELSTNKLSQYKTAAAKDAKKADQAGDFKRGDKRLGGMVQATKKQFDNDAKKVDESRAARRALMARIVNAR